jgi:hypothetical protein
MNEFYIDMGLSILFSVLRQKQFLPKWERAFRKLFNSIGMAYGWTTVPAEESDLVKTRKG